MNFPTTSNTGEMPRTTEFWHALSSEETMKLLQADSKNGLSLDEVVRRQQYFGTNELKETGKRSSLSILWDQFTNIMFLEAGVQIAADGRLLQEENLQIGESTLTGEAVAVNKNSTLVLAEDTPLGDRLNLVFKGTE